ncbi:MAG: hypothetical protein IJW49_07745 [Clostridia bacterium]|nr:hypothetical protein [Clostridia bacterium]
MIIWIDQKGEVVSVAQGALAESAEVDNVTSFRVAALEAHGKNEMLYFDPETRSFYTRECQAPDAEAGRAAAKRADAQRAAKRTQEAVLRWLSENDWKVNKHTLGEWSDEDPRWLAYLEMRKSKRAEYDEAVALLHTTAI